MRNGQGRGWTGRRLVRTGVGLALALVAIAVAPTWWSQVRPAPAWSVPAERVQAATEALETLPVVPEPRPLDGYQRDHFGPAWFDISGNGCDTRNDQLSHWLTDVVHDPVQPCVVISGVLHDPYTGNVLTFERGPETSAAVQIDHVVALADAWRKGADAWPATLALAFANDPANLIAVDGPTNQDKGAADAAHWLPPDERFHCAYAVQQILVKDSYAVGVSPEELGALTHVVHTCPAGAEEKDGLSRAGLTGSGAAVVGRDPRVPVPPRHRPRTPTRTGP